MNSLSSESSSRMSSVATPSPPPKDASVYEKLSWCHQFDTKSKEDVAMNRRVGFYKFKSEIGAGNFSKVKLAHHQLTNGSYLILLMKWTNPGQKSFVLYVDVAIKSYAISPMTGSTFDGFINCTLHWNDSHVCFNANLVYENVSFSKKFLRPKVLKIKIRKSHLSFHRNPPRKKNRNFGQIG